MFDSAKIIKKSNDCFISGEKMLSKGYSMSPSGRTNLM